MARGAGRAGVTMPGGRGRIAIGVLALAVTLLFAGRWVAMLLADRWWAQIVASEGAPFLTRWHLLGLALELGGILLAGAWCVGHLLLVVRSITSVQVPRRVGDLEIRELVGPGFLRPGAVLLGLGLGILFGAGGSAMSGTVMLAWHGTAPTVADPVLGLDLGVYLVQLPLWVGVLTAARRLVWVALVIAAGAHFLVGGIRAARPGLAMTDAARQQTALLAAAALVVAAFGEALGPLLAVAGLDTGPWSGLAPMMRWGIAIVWIGAAVALAGWALKPAPRRLLGGTLLWVIPLLLGSVVAAATAGDTAVPAASAEGIGGRATGVDQVLDGPATARDPLLRVEPGLWARRVLPALLTDRVAGRLLAAAPQRLRVAGEDASVWVALRDDSAGRSLVVLSDDRLGPGGGPITFRDGDPLAYPGVVTWRPLPRLAVAPEAPDTLVAGAPGIRIGGTPRRLTLAWGTQSPAVLASKGADDLLSWRRAPRDRVAHLFPPAWWDEPRPLLRDGRLWWVVDGWFLGAGAPLAPAIPWDGVAMRYARLGLVALIDADSGTVRIYRRPDVDAVANAWGELARGLIAPADSIPAGLLEASPSERWMAVAARAFVPGTDLPGIARAWGPRGPVPEAVLDEGGPAVPTPGRVRALLFGAPGVAVVRVTWPEGDAPLTPRELNTRWGRFATYERLDDSVRAAGGRMLAGEVRYDATPTGVMAVRNRWALSASGSPTVAWVEVAEGEKLGAAHTPAAALANLRGESAPVVPDPGSFDRLHEARRWAAIADSALRAGDLQGFGHAFEALKRVLATP